MAQVNTEKSLPSDKSPNVQGRPTTSVNTAFDARQGVQFLPTLNDPRYHYPPSAVNRVVQAPPVPPPVAPIDNSFQPAFPIFDSHRPPEPDFRPNFLFNGPMRSPFGAPMNLVRGPMFNPSDMLQPPPNLNTPFSVPNMPPPPPLFDLPPWLRPSLSIPPGPPPKPAFFPFPPDAFGPAGPPPKPAFFPLPPDAFGPAGPPPKPAFFQFPPDVFGPAGPAPKPASFQFPPDAVGPAGPQPKPGFLQFPPDAVGPAMAAPSEHQIFRHLISGTTGPLGPMFRPRMYKR
ncbi:hypothetical protein Tcan_14903 [Toxocara canis]|uniref:Uncharacterized protein n=1 Tax=Toxocara canis TaxID=6265 RepID=A0A0B2V6E1_TOXCA|nr:hypothetical protein Tcan_14903 [Toxocara canis]